MTSCALQKGACRASALSLVRFCSCEYEHFIESHINYTYISLTHLSLLSTHASYPPHEHNHCHITTK
jgi:hypothetical protein